MKNKISIFCFIVIKFLELLFKVSLNQKSFLGLPTITNTLKKCYDWITSVILPTIECQTSCFVKYLSQCLMQSFPIQVSSRLLFFQCEVFFDIAPKENRTKTVTQILLIIIALVGFLQITKTICNQSFSWFCLKKGISMTKHSLTKYSVQIFENCMYWLATKQLRTLVLIINISQIANAKNKTSIYNRKVSSAQPKPTTYIIYSFI